MAASVLGELALLDVGRGRLRRAVELATEAVEDAELGGTTVGTPSVGAELALGWVQLLWDDLGAAERHLDRAAAAAEPREIAGAASLQPHSGHSFAARGARARQVPRWRSCAAGRSTWTTWQPPLALAPILETAEARLLAARGDVEACAGRPRPEGEPVRRVGGDRAAAGKARARRGQTGGSARDPRAPAGGAGGLFGLGIEACVLTAVARHAVHDDEGAGEALENALGPRRAEQLPAAVPGRRLGRPGAARAADQVGTAHRSFAGELLAAFRKRAPSVAVTRVELLEPLSGREQSVLRFLPTMMSNAEIAGELFVTSNTVKTHLKSIYRKLAVSRRRDAVERARALELL